MDNVTAFLCSNSQSLKPRNKIITPIHFYDWIRYSNFGIQFTVPSHNIIRAVGIWANGIMIFTISFLILKCRLCHHYFLLLCFLFLKWYSSSSLWLCQLLLKSFLLLQQQQVAEIFWASSLSLESWLYQNKQ